MHNIDITCCKPHATRDEERCYYCPMKLVQGKKKPSPSQDQPAQPSPDPKSHKIKELR